jgi:hypothetical protein
VDPCRALIRVRVPDRPGALGLVASRIGAVKGDIVGIEVVDRQDGTALDRLSVILPDAELIPTLEREIAEVDGAEVMGVDVVAEFPEPRLDEVRYALALSRAHDVEGLASVLVERVTRLVGPEWCRAQGPGVAVGTESGATPVTETVTESIELRMSGITLSFGLLTPLQRGERALVTGYADLVDALWLRLPADAGPPATPR